MNKRLRIDKISKNRFDQFLGFPFDLKFTFQFFFNPSTYFEQFPLLAISPFIKQIKS